MPVYEVQAKLGSVQYVGQWTFALVLLKLLSHFWQLPQFLFGDLLFPLLNSVT